MSESIRLRGVRVHNLKNVDLDIPRGELTVFTGVSGSGKSSLAFDTLYAEGQRRYVESLSTYARQFLERMDRPDADHLDGLPPAIAIQQRAPVTGGRSTVGTVTEIQDYLRLLWARIGVQHCTGCGRVLAAEAAAELAARLIEDQAGIGTKGEGRISIGFPVDTASVLKTVGREGFIESVRGNGFLRVRIGHDTLTLEEAAAAKLGPKTRLGVIVSRLAARPGTHARLLDAIETAYSFGHGRCFTILDDGAPVPHREDRRCPVCDLDAPRMIPALFSFNSPLGACPGCHGFGRSIDLDWSLVIPDPRMTLRQRPIEPWNFPAYSGHYEALFAAAREKKISLDVPWGRMKASHRKWVESGDGHWAGIAGFFKGLEAKSYKVHVRVFLSRFRTYRTCPVCSGARLRAEALAVTVRERTIAAAAALTTREALEFFDSLPLTRMQDEIARPVLLEVRRRLRYLVEIGLDYLTLDRLSRSLSGGEGQRIHLATSLGSGLVGSLYVLDEPSIGLHPRDNDRLVGILKSLRDLGNTVVVVEHDPAIIRAADHVVDFGPGAGERGGRIVATGTPDEIIANPDSLTGQWLSGRRSILPASAAAAPARSPSGWLELTGARANNLADLTVRFPLGVLCCVTGVSGSGKSSLVDQTLSPALRHAFGESVKEVGPHDGLAGIAQIEAAVVVSQSPIGRTPRSNPITYMDGFADIRESFAATGEARARGLTAASFSFNRPGGRCESCAGAGTVTVEMHFLADVTVTCEACNGKRYKDGTLAVRLRGRSMADVLEMTVEEAHGFFADRPGLVSRLGLLVEAGLGYLRLGQPASTLSGGESQRLKLAEALSHGRGNTFYLFDEPTTGLHLADVARLLACFDRLLAQGHSLLVVEHHLEVIRRADWIIDLGPGAAAQGGRLVAAGPPDAIAANRESVTGRFLAPMYALGA